MKPRSDDERTLTFLHLRDHEGMTGTEIAARFRTTRSAVLGSMNRIDREYRKDNDPLRNNKDGTLKPKWWSKK